MADLVIVTPDLPYPPTGGGKIKTFFLLEHLCRQHRVGLVSVLKGDDAAQLDGLRSALPLDQVVTHPVDVGRGPVNLARSLLHRRTLNEYRTWSDELAAQARPLLDRADVVIADHLETVQYVPERLWPRTVYHSHNAEHLLWRRYGGVPGSPVVRLAAHFESRRIAARERRYCNGVAAVLAAPDDRAALEEIGADRASFHRTYHIGDDAVASLPDVEWDQTEELVFFLGTLSWEANADGLVWFLDEVWPSVVERRPGARFVIGGKAPPPDVRVRVEALPGVEAVGFVDDPEIYLSRARVFVAPLRFGSGMKLKVVEALMRGVPTVTTSIGAESIAAEPGRHLELADDPAGQAAAVCGLLADRTRWTSMRAHARALARERYTWATVAADADACIAEVLARRDVS